MRKRRFEVDIEGQDFVKQIRALLGSLDSLDTEHAQHEATRAKESIVLGF